MVHQHPFLFLPVFSILLLAIPALAEQQRLQYTVRATRVVDLTHELHSDMTYWPGGVPFAMKRLVDYDQGYLLHKFEMGENTGTHVDAPSHFIRGLKAIDQLALSDLIVPAVVIDIQPQVKSNPDYRLTANDIKQWEAKHGRIPAGSLVIVNSGWHGKFNDPAAYINMDDNGVMHFPGFGPDSVRLLVNRDVTGIGIDTLSIDYGPSKDFAAHNIMLNADRYQLENLANLNALPAKDAIVVIGVLPVRDGSQAQARIFALLP